MNVQADITMERPLVVELVGVAGSGKTTLAQNLSEQNARYQHCLHPNPRNLADFPFYMVNSQILLRLLFSRENKDRAISRREIAWLAVLRGWPARLRRKNPLHDCLLIDQGPVFLTAAFHHFDLEKLDHSLASAWWNDVIERWSQTLDMIVWLDADDQTLIQRIRNRDKAHEAKALTNHELTAYIHQHRKVYEQTISLFGKSLSQRKIIKLDTSLNSLPEMTRQLRDKLYR